MDPEALQSRLWGVFPCLMRGVMCLPQLDRVRWIMFTEVRVSSHDALLFIIVALPGVGHMPAVGDDETEAARVFYVAATRATQRLVIGAGGLSAFGQRLG